MKIITIKGREHLYGKCYPRDLRFDPDMGGEPELLHCKFAEPMSNIDSFSEIVSVEYDSEEEQLGKVYLTLKDGSGRKLDVFFDKFLSLIS